LIPDALLERETEVSTLDEALESAAADAGRVVIIEGDAGLGKSRLVEVAAALAWERGFRVLRARAAALEEDLPFGVVRQLFERPLARLHPEERDEVLGGVARFARPLLDGSDHPTGPIGETHVLQGLYWMAANLCRRHPLLLCVDDAQWADLASLRWLGYLTRRLDGLPLTIVVASRPGARQEAHGWLTALEQEAWTQRIVNRPGIPGGSDS
jgi:predicted ATPase